MHGEHLSGALSPVRAAPWAQPNGQHHRPPTVPINLEDSAPGRAVRGTRPGHERTIQATPSEENDPGAPKPWVPHRIRQCSIDPPAYFRPWLCLGRCWPRWKEALVLIQPATVARWHREGLRRCWSRRSGRRPGRPRIDSEVRALIRRMAAENRLWGAPRIHGELLKIGIAVSERTVSRYLENTRIAPSQTWRTFLANHFDQLAVTWPVMFCGAPEEDDDIDPCGEQPRRASISVERSYVCDQWSLVPRHRSPQRTSVDRQIGQAYVHHRKCDH